MKIFKFISSIVICFLVAFFGSVFTTPSIPTWYAGLDKPFFNPPNWVFAPAWTILYFLMAVSLYIVWDKNLKAGKTNKAIETFVFQLALNFLWSLIFFGLHMPWLAFATIFALWIAIFMTIKAFYKISKTSAYLLIPYLLWVTFASLLNLAVAILN